MIDFFKKTTTLVIATLIVFSVITRGTAAKNNKATSNLRQQPEKEGNKKQYDYASLEDLLLATPDPQRLRESLRTLTQHSHVAATHGDFENAYFVRDQLLSFGGWDARVEEVRVMMTYPNEQPTLTTSFGFQAKLSEDILEKDATSGTTNWRNHTFLAYSPSGKVTANLVYANYGRPEDFDVLQQLGVSVNGKIVIMRYGECFRGLKVMNAEARGAIGSIIYSDPQQDGFSKGKTFDEGGPWRPPSGVQRGSLQHNSKCAGDPWRLYSENTTSVKDICGYETADMVPKHPALPLSYEDAKPLLEKLGGVAAPAEFQGGLPFNYTVGPSSYTVTMETNHTFEPRTIPNVIATMLAQDHNNNDESSTPSIILGNHRDAWVFGAVDPNSGTTALLEVGRTLSVLQNQTGWKPKRNIILASWSGEEYGLLGSTAYAEMNSAEMDTNVIAYLNVDCAVTGNVSLEVSATHSLNKLFAKAAARVPAPPKPGTTTQDTGNNRTMADMTVWNHKVGTLGSGSDYTAFLDRFGVSSMDMSFKGDYGVYHSVYDSMSWMESQGDPTFEIHQAMTRLWALMAFRLAHEKILPIYMTYQATQVHRDVNALKRDLVATFGRRDDLDQAVHHLEVAKDLFMKAAIAIDKEVGVLEEVNESSSRLPWDHPRDNKLLEQQAHAQKNSASLNRRLAFCERHFVGPGLPKRPWFRHVLQAPGFFLGYGSQAFPGVAQAILDKDVPLAQSEIATVAKALTQAAKFLQSGEEQAASSSEASDEAGVLV